MPNTRYRLRSELPNTVETQSLLTKIASNLAEGPDTRVVLEIGFDRFNSHDCTNVSISGTGTTNNIQFQRPGKAAKGALGGVNYVAKQTGTNGNSITVAYTSGGTAGSEAVTVTGSAISVQIATGVSTEAQIAAAVNGSTAAAALVSASASSGSTAVTAPAGPATLAGGLGTSTVEKYDLADIENIRRLRTKKHLIVIKSDANPA